MCKDNKIAYHILEVNEWLDCSKIIKHNRGVEENKEVYRKCCAKNMATLSDGKLFRCPYAANAARLRAVPDYKEDYMDLFTESLTESDIQETKNKMKDYFLKKEYLETCDFCSTRPLAGSTVEPAIQLTKPLPYKKYNS